MSAYVDGLVGYGWKLGPNCHLIADSMDELHAFAAHVGMKRSWFQQKSTPHYDLTESRRKIAVQLGAVELDRKSFVAKIRELRGPTCRCAVEYGDMSDCPIHPAEWLQPTDPGRSGK